MDDYSSSNSTKIPDIKDRWKDSKAAGGLRAAGSSLASSGQSMISDARYESESRIHDVSYKKGGRVRKTGTAYLHKNERVIPANNRKRVEKMMRKSKMRMKARR